DLAIHCRGTIESPEVLVARILAAAGEIAEDQTMIRKTVPEWFVLEPAFPKKEGTSNQNCSYQQHNSAQVRNRWNF
ncbi:Hypothetical predicted protein, partial [Olea europaea subsp. europaea]